MRGAFALVAILFLSAAAYPQDIVVKSSPDTSSIIIGDQIGFSVSATIPSGIDAVLSTMTDTLTGKIVILGRSDRDTVISPDGKLTVTDRYLITGFDSGTYSIPPFYAEYISGDSLKKYYSDYCWLITPIAAPFVPNVCIAAARIAWPCHPWTGSWRH
jgi:hypothetical protein